jgi:hypothetical protein
MPSDDILPDDYDEWRAVSLRNLRAHARAYEQGLMANEGLDPAEAHRVADQKMWNSWRELDGVARGHHDGASLEM